MNPKYRESVNSIPSDNEVMYPGEEVSDLHTYEGFGTRMSETLLLSLGYFSDEELEHAGAKGPAAAAAVAVGQQQHAPAVRAGGQRHRLHAHAAQRQPGRQGPGAPRAGQLQGPAAGLHRQHPAGRLLQFLGGDRGHQERHQRPVRPRHSARPAGAPGLPGRVRHRRAGRLARPGHRAEGPGRPGHADLLQPARQLPHHRHLPGADRPLPDHLPLQRRARPRGLALVVGRLRGSRRPPGRSPPARSAR